MIQKLPDKSKKDLTIELIDKLIPTTTDVNSTSRGISFDVKEKDKLIFSFLLKLEYISPIENEKIFLNYQNLQKSSYLKSPSEIHLNFIDKGFHRCLEVTAKNKLYAKVYSIIILCHGLSGSPVNIISKNLNPQSPYNIKIALYANTKKNIMELFSNLHKKILHKI